MNHSAQFLSLGDTSFQWECKDGSSCIDLRRRCDGYTDCADLSDEDLDMCPASESDKYNIYTKSFTCNVSVPCDGDWQFHCEDRKTCIDKRRVCDGYIDCYDRSDEANCQDGET